jgi:hypothetical protein
MSRASPRGWDEDEEEQLDKEVGPRSPLATGNVRALGASLGAAPATLSASLRSLGALDDHVAGTAGALKGANAAELEATVRQLMYDLSESRRNEEILTVELRRLRREYDNGIVQHQQSLIASSSSSGKQLEEFAQWFKQLEGELERKDEAGAGAGASASPGLAEGAAVAAARERESAAAQFPAPRPATLRKPPGVQAAAEESIAEVETRIESSLAGKSEADKQALKEKALNVFLRGEVNRLRALLNQTWAEAQEQFAAFNRDLEQARLAVRTVDDKLAQESAWSARLRAALDVSKKQERRLDLERQAVTRAAEELRRTTERAAAEASLADGARASEIKALLEAVEEHKTKARSAQREVEELKIRARQEAAKHEKDMYNQFVAYRELRKNTSEIADAWAGFARSVALVVAVPEPEPANPSSEPGDSPRHLSTHSHYSHTHSPRRRPSLGTGVGSPRLSASARSGALSELGDVVQVDCDGDTGRNSNSSSGGGGSSGNSGSDNSSSSNSSNNNNNNQHESSNPPLRGPATRKEMQVEQDKVLQALSEMKSALVGERRQREVAERNFGICHKRLDRALSKIDALNSEVSGLQVSTQDIAGMSVAEYERFIDEFRATTMLRRAGAATGKGLPKSASAGGLANLAFLSTAQAISHAIAVVPRSGRVNLSLAAASKSKRTGAALKPGRGAPGSALALADHDDPEPRHRAMPEPGGYHWAALVPDAERIPQHLPGIAGGSSRP